MDDTPGLGRPQQDDDQLSHTLTVHQVSERLTTAGVPRSERQIKRYCESAFLDAKKVPGPSGDQWFVAPAALPKLIGDLQQWQMQRAGHSETRPAVTDHGTPEKSNAELTDTPGLGRPQQAVADKENKAEREVGNMVTSSYVTQLETRINEKDEVIGMLRGELTNRNDELVRRNERERETNVLIRGLQNLVLQLQVGRPSGSDVFDGDSAMSSKGTEDAEDTVRH
jgi:hypothetical protein